MFCKSGILRSFRLLPRKCNKLQFREKNGPNHWSVLAKKKTPKDRALEHFDDFYGSVFGKKWPSVRLAILSPNQHCALVNNYSDVDRIVTHLESLGAIDMKRLLDIEAQKIQEAKKRKKRNKAVKLIPELDDKLEKFSQVKQKEELDKLYPQGVETSNFEQRLESPSDRIVGTLDTTALHEFVPTSRLKGMDGWVPESRHYSYYDTPLSDASTPVVEQRDIQFPQQLRVFLFLPGCVEEFPDPDKGTTGVQDYQLVDGASVLAVLALGLEPGDCVLDLCACPGDKSMLCLQTLYPKSVNCCDVNEGKLMAIRREMRSYFYDFDKKLANGEVVISVGDGRFVEEYNTYDKIVVNVPCTSDREAVMSDNNNLFHPTRVKDRIKLPEVQAEILTKSLKLVKPGGTVLYCTSSLSPVQNEGVVKMALNNIEQESDMRIAVIDMKKALEPARAVFRFATDIGLKYGHLVLPYLPANYGPIYLCKFIKAH